MPVHLNLPDAAATERLGAWLAAGVAPGRVVHLRGDLGAGKTTLVRGLLHALGHSGRVKSPTYTLVEPYTLSRLHLYHFDFYRFHDRSEWVGSGFRDYFSSDTVCLVEWPERAGDLLAPPDLQVRLEIAGETRRALVEACTAAGTSWLSSLPPFS
jgi:tRNA threonylcarbamoyladenosine biosynthesis protein TsaE